MNWPVEGSSLGEGGVLTFALVPAAALGGLLLCSLLFRFLTRLAGRSDTDFDDLLVRRWWGPARLLFPLLAIVLVSPLLQLPTPLQGPLRHLFSLVLIAVVAWLLAATALGLRDIILSRYDITARDNLKARVVYTQINVLVKIVLVVIGIVAIASMLMTFEKIRQVGVSILASAGIVGIVAGFAAQRSLATLFAGIQIAITQPIRLDDVVIVEGEWGRIEEITLTYVVVCIWDLRRLIVPITYFLEKPFQNWTRVSAEMLGTVSLHVDYTVPVEAVRQELLRILQGTENWDGKVCGVQVTNATDRTVELRALMSAADASLAWNLRCEVREKLIDFIRKDYPESLPRLRAEVEGAAAGS